MADKVYKHSLLETVFYVSFGLAICFIGIKILGFLYGETHNLLGMFLLGILLPIPMIICGFYLIISTLRYKIEVTDDEIIINTGLTKNTTVKRESIQSYKLTSNQRVELKTDTTLIKQQIPKAFSSSNDFVEWFENIEKVPEFKKSEGFISKKYPKTYQPTLKQLLTTIGLSSFMVVIYFYFFLEVALHHPPQNKFSLVSFLLISFLLLFVMTTNYYAVIIGIIKYKVTLYPDSLHIYSILGDYKIQRTQIKSYSYSHVGSGGRRWLPTLWLKLENQEKEFILYLAFTPDQTFNEWFSGIPVPMIASSLPNIEEEL
jgi:hypothetical protein